MPPEVPMHLRVNFRNALVVSAVLIGSLLGATRGTQASASSSTVGDALLSFETHVKWAAVSDKWAGARPAWIGRVKAADTVGALATEILALETAMGWGAVED